MIDIKKKRQVLFKNKRAGEIIMGASTDKAKKCVILIPPNCSY